MAIFQIGLVLSLLLATALAAPDQLRQQYRQPQQQHSQQQHQQQQQYQPQHQQQHQPMPHQFSYTVKDDYGNDYGHSEVSDGKVVKGEYRVLLPDGRLQVVTYTADHENGYVATVQYQGEARYPEPAPEQSYNAPAHQSSYGS